MFRHAESLALAAGTVGIRATLSSLVARPEDGLDVLEDNRAAFHACAEEPDDRVRVAVGVEWIPLATAEMLRDAASLATDLGTGLHIHLSESKQEVETCMQDFGARPVRVAYDHGLLGPSTVAAHCVWLTDEDIGMIAETGRHVSHNPAANSKLGEGIAPARELLDAGVNVGLGHDATEGNNTMDIFEVIAHRGVPTASPPRRPEVDAGVAGPANGNGKRGASSGSRRRSDRVRPQGRHHPGRGRKRVL